jgi:hypothetical protein
MPWRISHKSLTASNESESYITTDGQSASLSLNKAPIWGLRPDYYYYQTIAGLLMWGALSDERTGLSFTTALVDASAVIFGGLMTIFYCLTFETSLFVASYDSLRRRYSTRPPHECRNKFLFTTARRLEYKSPSRTVPLFSVILFVVTGMHLLIFVAGETGVSVPLPSKLTSASAAIPAFRPCLSSRCLAMDIHITLWWKPKPL